MNVIDALVVSLTLDATQFQQGQKDAETSTGRLRATVTEHLGAIRKATEAMAAGQSKAADEGVKGAGRQSDALSGLSASYKRLRGEVLGLIGLFVAGRSLGGFVDEVTRSDDALGRLSRRVGMSVGDLGALEGAARRAGGTAEGIAGSIEGLGSRMEQFKLTGEGADSFMVPLARMGINAFGADGQLASVQSLFPQLAKRFAEYDAAGDPQKTNVFGSQLGLDTGTVGFLRQGQQNYEAQIARERKWAPTGQDSANARAVLAQVDDMRSRVTAFGRHLLNDLTPTFVRLLSKFGDWLDAHLPTIERFIDGYLQRFARWLQSFDWTGLEQKGERLWKNAADFFDKLSNWEPPGWLKAAFKAAGIDISTAPASGPTAPGVPPTTSDAPGSLPSKLTPLQSGQAGEEAIRYFMSQGDDLEHASGRVGNMMRESGGDPLARAASPSSGDGQTLGIFQWDKARRDAIVAAFNTAHPGANKTWATMGYQDQLWGSYWETKDGPERGHMDAFNKATDAGTAARMYSRDVIRPKDRSPDSFEAIRRAHMAEEARDRHTYPSAHPSTTLPPDYVPPPPVTAYPGRTFEQMRRDADAAQRGSDAAEWASQQGNAEDARKHQQFTEFLRQLGHRPRAAGKPGTEPSGDPNAMLPHPISYRGTAPVHLIPTASVRWHVNHVAHSTSHTETHIGDVHVHTQAKDGRTAAREMWAALQSRTGANQSDRGLA